MGVVSVILGVPVRLMPGRGVATGGATTGVWQALLRMRVQGVDVVLRIVAAQHMVNLFRSVHRSRMMIMDVLRSVMA